MRQRAAPRHGEVPEGGRAGGLHSAAEVRCATSHSVSTVQYAKNAKVCMSRFEPTSRVLKSSILSIRPNFFLKPKRACEVILNLLKVLIEARVVRVL